jgi:hypothetical protein
LRRVHFEQGTDARRQRQQVRRRQRRIVGEGPRYAQSALDRPVVRRSESRIERDLADLRAERAWEDVGSWLGAVLRRRVLDDLHAPAVTMEIPERPDVHQQVEGEGVAGLELAREIVMGTTSGD